MAWRSSHGTTFTFNAQTYKCLDVSYETSAPARETVDMSTLDLDDGDEMIMVSAPLKPRQDPKKFSITYKSEGTEIEAGTEGTLSCDGKSGTYLCTGATVALKTNTYVEGTATFEEVLD
jgi:hypothetical protein